MNAPESVLTIFVFQVVTAHLSSVVGAHGSAVRRATANNRIVVGDRMRLRSPQPMIPASALPSLFDY